MDLPKSAYTAIEVLEQAGYEAWFVGGCVRDSLRGCPIHDIDIATNAHWQQTKQAFERADYEIRETGIAHGTVTALIPEEPEGRIEAFEITTYRVDSTTSQDARHPDSVAFVNSIEEDLQRRDFTINAMAYHPARGLLDPYGGAEDLERTTIRAVGDPSARFKEDALRILRACRFCAQLGFSIEASTYEAMVARKSYLAQVSIERKAQELEQFVIAPFAGRALLETVDVLSYVLPELVAMKDCPQRTKYHIYDVLEHTACALDSAPPERIVRWAVLCHDMGKPASAFFDGEGVEHFYGHSSVSAELAFGMMHRLRLSPAFIDRTCAIIRLHSDKIAPTRKSVRRALAKIDGDVEFFRALLKLKRADILAHAPRYAAKVGTIDEIEAVFDEVLEEGEAFSLAGLALKGDDLLRAGIPEGQEIGRLLKKALEGCIEGAVPNEKEALLDHCLGKERVS